MKIKLFLLCFFALGNLHAQDGPNPSVSNEYLIYFEDGTTTTEVTNIANIWCSTVINNLQPGGNIALFKFNCSFPYTDPYDPSESISDLIGVVGNIKKKEPKATGGSENYEFNGHTPGIILNNCYNENLLKGDTDDASRVKVAVFDTGTNWDAANMIGFDFGIPHEMFGDATDKNGHGTHVASIVNKTYLESNNGVNDQVDYAFGNPLNSSGYGTLAEMVISMERAVESGANIINGSFAYMRRKLHFGQVSPGTTPGTSGDNIGEEDVLYLLMKSANPTTTLFVVSAGNDNGFDLDGNSDWNVYPAAFPLENMITVASHGCTEKLSGFSNFGKISVDIAAPGENIVSIDHDMNLASFDGSSQSAAYTSGGGSVIATHLPQFDAAKVKCAILTKAAYRSSFDNLTATAGILDIGAAVDYIKEGGCNSGHGGNVHMKIGQENINTEVSISPTLVTSHVDISFRLEADSPVKIAIYSTNGQLLSSSNETARKGSNQISVNLDHISNPGMLLIRIETNEFTKTKKIISIQ